MRLFGGPLDIGMPRAQQQAARRTHAGTDQAEIGSGIEQARIPLSPARQELIDLVAQTHERRI
jgi:hypothetical protein